MWWQCDDDNITEINNLLEGIYIIESQNNKNNVKSDVRLKRFIICVISQNKPSDKIQLCFYKNYPARPKSIL